MRRESAKRKCFCVSMSECTPSLTCAFSGRLRSPRARLEFRGQPYNPNYLRAEEDGAETAYGTPDRGRPYPALLAGQPVVSIVQLQPTS